MCAEGSNMYSCHDCAMNCAYTSTKGEFGDKSADIWPISSHVSEKEANKITVMPSGPRYLLHCMHKQKRLLIKISPFPTHKNGMSIPFHPTSSILLRMSAFQGCPVHVCPFLAIRGHLFSWK